jgi:hypothetical protein
MSRQQRLFATKADLLAGLLPFEAKYPVKYVPAESRSDPNIEAYLSVKDIPQLGMAPTDDIFMSMGYYVIEAEADFTIEKIVQFDGEIYYLAEVPGLRTILKFQPGGLFDADCLIASIVWTYTGTKETLSLFRRFVRAATKGFMPVHNEECKWWVGPEALTLYRRGVRLITLGAKEPPKYDLQIDLTSLS